MTDSIERYLDALEMRPEDFLELSDYLDYVEKHFGRHYNWKVEEVATNYFYKQVQEMKQAIERKKEEKKIEKEIEKEKQEEEKEKRKPKAKKPKRIRVRKAPYRGRKEIDNVTKAKIIALRQQGLSRDKISKELKLGHDTVQVVLNELKPK